MLLLHRFELCCTDEYGAWRFVCSIYRSSCEHYAAVACRFMLFLEEKRDDGDLTIESARELCRPMVEHVKLAADK